MDSINLYEIDAEYIDYLIPMAPHLFQNKKPSQLNTRKYIGVIFVVNGFEHRCSITGKKNSKGNQTWFIGYKAHIAVDDRGIPVAFVTTGACVHDSQLAIPLLRKSMRVCDFDFTLMDAGYSSTEIEEFAIANNIFPIIDFKANSKGEKVEMTAELAYRYKKRTTVERTNSELMECFLIEKLYSRGEKAHFDIQLSVLLLTIKKIRENLKQVQLKEVA